MEYIAHTKNSSTECQSLKKHLQSTARIAGSFAQHFDSQEWGSLLGLWHDIGKIQPNFQQFILQEAGIIPHKRNISKIERAHAKIGAVALYKLLSPPYAIPLAYCIEGHHNGIADWHGGLDNKIIDTICWDAVEEQNFLPQPNKINFPKFTHQYQLHQWIRMLYSTLVDADWLDTEQFMNPEQAAARGKYDTMEVLKSKLDNYLKRFDTAPSTTLNQHRASILEQCRSKGSEKPGIFNLTVPTGGGKTLSSMAWAINHAIAHGKRRIIVVIPYTSIITQNAAIFREIFGSNNVLEHHSNLTEDVQNEMNVSDSLRLSMENWDVPIVVTTNVQLFESLHSNRRSDCRKIHNVTNSVLIIDEAQMLPIEFLKPILQSIEGLVDVFRSSILLTTATQPVFVGEIGQGKKRFKAIELPVKEIVENSNSLHSLFKRTTLHRHLHHQGISVQALAEELKSHRQFLCIVNTRTEAQKLCRELPEDTIHLSRNMCSHHLMEQIRQIKILLSEGSDVRVVSTQLIEAGVDIDFPIVYRAMAGMDSIVQAAGRCNREGKNNCGNVFVFKLEGERLRGLMGQSESALLDLLHENSLDELASPTMLKRYFEKLYNRIEEMDKPKTVELLINDAGQLKMQFAEYASNFRLIDDKGSERVLIQMDGGKDIYEKMQSKEPLTLADYRAIQQYSVSVPKYIADQIKKQGGIDESCEVKVLAKSFYDARYGVVVDGIWANEFLYT